MECDNRHENELKLRDDLSHFRPQVYRSCFVDKEAGLFESVVYSGEAF